MFSAVYSSLLSKPCFEMGRSTKHLIYTINNLPNTSTPEITLLPLFPQQGKSKDLTEISLDEDVVGVAADGTLAIQQVAD